MNDNYLYVGVTTTTAQEVIAKEHHDYPIESSETHTIAGPEAPVAPMMSAPMLVGTRPILATIDCPKSNLLVII